MEDREILEKVIYRAVKNGCHYTSIDILEETWRKRRFYYAVIFDHEFAKCFWAEKCEWDIHSWKYHLQQMILCEEPLKYLEKFIN